MSQHHSACAVDAARHVIANFGCRHISTLTVYYTIQPEQQQTHYERKTSLLDGKTAENSRQPKGHPALSSL